MDEYWNPMVPELSVSNFTTSLRFYCEILGFKIRNQRDNPDFAYLELEKVQIMLEQIHDEAWATDSLVAPFGRGVNFQIELSDISSIYERIQAADIKLFKELKETWYDIGEILSGQKEFLIQDPDGYLLRFTEYLGEKSKS
ncbi:VOC family protein [Vibrio metschnikovii]|uniref:Bleomycin resistance protein n=1 Tax=bacterium 19MO03SA05 TaxID=2920620 RepID=A0AAU6VLX8_UNCXX|nr:MULTISPECIES: VOC family protein [unclassified Vibrio]EKO3629356.1 VOC family protein [Vibrio metschnikovii]EKO3674743.1 VOC family protein [Vibrio metschnikovii]EKO3922558.1 VOC family protein [Vibrio metschnikovii]MDQ2110120.1 VOC family protein [Vibrio sp. 2017_1457_15]MDQ2162961.1 VOC family protein [Vibrio sp. 2017_1457_13]